MQSSVLFLISLAFPDAYPMLMQIPFFIYRQNKNHKKAGSKNTPMFFYGFSYSLPKFIHLSFTTPILPAERKVSVKVMWICVKGM
jgi:hypothetical protein